MKGIMVLLLAIFASTLAFKDSPKMSNAVVLYNEHGRITNGTLAVKGQFPYLVRIRLYSFANKINQCSGSIISSIWVLTAAHCFGNINYCDIYFGEISEKTARFQHRVYNKSFVLHPEYDGGSKHNDAAMIIIPRISFSKYVNKIELANEAKHANLTGWRAYAPGWGARNDTPIVSKHLYYINVTIADDELCEAFHYFQPSQLCVSTAHNQSTCRGDSGGPLTLHKGNFLAGISSYGGPSCLNNVPQVFTRVTKIFTWIRDVMDIVS
ncbi:serine protease 1-like [Scaptodrosophila lebanonensis]|uniref:Serine protease 1-like n=1 Tax=Drosophila lebanonensis TaxID=7225 RepID=A0A6J2TNV9_DROLE|nr:serine protease 1-like [Scaptodrosophila lebanonensis]